MCIRHLFNPGFLYVCVCVCVISLVAVRLLKEMRFCDLLPDDD